MSEAEQLTPVAWRVTGGRAYVDTAHLEKIHAETRVSQRKDGASVVPLYASSDVMMLMEQRDALTEALALHLQNFEAQHALLLEIGNPDFINMRDKARAALAMVKGSTP